MTTPGNVIAFNGGNGITISGADTTGNALRGNAIHSNSGLGIDLGGDGVTLNDPGDSDVGPNNLINAPVLTTVQNGATTTVTGTFNGAGSGPFILEFFALTTPDASGHGEGQRLLGSTTLAAAGAFSATLAATGFGEWISATVMDAQGNTSEFSLALQTNNRPTARAGGPYTIAEGGSLTLDASASSDLDGDALLYSWDINRDGIFGDATGVNPTLSWTDLVALGLTDGARIFPARVRVDDQQGGVALAVAPLSITNTAPTAGLVSPGDAVRFQDRLFTLTAADPSPVDQDAGFTFDIDWDGDGTIDETQFGPSGTGRRGPVPGSAIYADGRRPIAGRSGRRLHVRH